MTALAAARMTEMRDPGRKRKVLMTASKTCYAGGMVMLVAAGTAEPATAAASNKGVIGVATETVTSAASGSYYVEIQEGTFKFNATSIAQTAMGDKVYASDDNTVDETQGSNEPLAGILDEYVSSTVGWVKIGLTESKL